MRTRMRCRLTVSRLLHQPRVQPPEGLGGGVEPDRLGAGRVNPGGREGRGGVEDAESKLGTCFEPGEGAGGIEQVVDHFATGLAEQWVIGAGGADERIESLADPQE